MENVIILGGTGRLGSMIVRKLVEQCLCKRICVISRDIQKQQLLAERYDNVEFCSVDICSKDLTGKFAGFDTVIHAAAMKDVVKCEKDVVKAIDVNVNGTINVVKEAQRAGVSHLIYASTDMSVEPHSVYGNSKALADAVVVNAAVSGLITCVVRFGNVIAPGSGVFSILTQKQRELGYFPITDNHMTRFIMSDVACVDFILNVISYAEGGEVFVPRCPSYSVTDVAKAIDSSVERRVVGLRPGDALSVTMISEVESIRTLSSPEYYVILPNNYDKCRIEQYRQDNNLEALPEGFSLTSENNTNRASVTYLSSFK